MAPRGLYDLAHRRVKESTLQTYKKNLSYFLDWLATLPADERQCATAKEIDHLFTRYCIQLFHSNTNLKPAGVAQAKSALEFFLPSLQGKLLVSTQSIRGWGATRSVEHHGVCPQIVVYGLAFDLFAHGNPTVGTGLLLLFDGYLRLGDLLQLQIDEVVLLPVDQERPHYGTISIKISKRGRNETVTIRPYFLRILLERILKTARKLGQKDLFPVPPARFRAQLRAAATRIKIPFRATPHMLRFGGATTDKLFSRLDDQAIKFRGRWQSDKNFKLYLQPHQLYEALNTLTPAQRASFEAVFTNALHSFNVPRPSWVGGLE